MFYLIERVYMINDELMNTIGQARRILIFSGAGMSAESGVPTFRDELTGLWEQYDPMDLATPEAFERDPALVWGWYMWRRQQVAEVEPNAGHRAIAAWQRIYPLRIVTQNVDDLHERAGSYGVVHVHGELFASHCHRCRAPHKPTALEETSEQIGQPIDPPHCKLCGGLVRPSVVWFGEALDEASLRAAIYEAENSDVVLAIGTSGLVQPAALVPQWAKDQGAQVIQINPNPTALDELCDINIRSTAAHVLPQIVEKLGIHN